MESTYILYNIVPFGFILLLIYIFVDILLDHFKKGKQNTIRRIILYSFLFYLLSLIQIKLGGVSFSLQNRAAINSTFISTYDWLGIYDRLNTKVTMGNQAFIYNFLLFIPLGIYLSLFFGVKHTKKVISILISSCLIYLIFHLIFNSTLLAFKTLNILDIIYLFFNIAGGLIGFLFSKQIKKFQEKRTAINKAF